MGLHAGKRADRNSVPVDRSTWRGDIQGLRAIAVLAVVAFHADLPVPGGFTGVDVFFVISGFVITSMLRREWDTYGRIRLKRFYWRRFKRLTPALAAMISVTVLISTFLLSPFGPQQDTAITGIFAILISANIAIFQTSGGYFDAPAEGNPLLNTWSLSVEEQIYLIFPLLLIFTWVVFARSGQKISRTSVVIAGTAAISFFLMLSASLGTSNRSHQIVSSFYNPIDRYWEFAAGALLALNAESLYRLGRSSVMTLRVTGASLLVLSFWFISEATVFPGIWTLAPVLGTVLVIASGCGDRVDESRLLTSRPLIHLGNWSYSIYLWHWPILVFAGLLWPKTAVVLSVAALLSLLPAVLSYHFIENPIRYAQISKRSQQKKFIALTLLTPIVLATVMLAVANTYWKASAAESLANLTGELGYDTMDKEVAASSFPCTIEQIPDEDMANLTNPCVQSMTGVPIDAAILGDSHAHQLFLGLADSLPGKNVLSVHTWGWPDETTTNTARTLEQIRDSSEIKAVIINAYWGQKLRIPVTEIRELAASGKQVFILDDFPTFSFQPQSCKFRSAFLLGSTQCQEDTSENLTERAQVVAELESEVAGIPNVNLIRTHELMCEGNRCDMSRDGSLLYSDDDHLNTLGSRFIANEIVERTPLLLQSLS